MSILSILYVVYNIIGNVSCCHTTDVGLVFARPGSNQSNYDHRMIGCGVIDHLLTYNKVTMREWRLRGITLFSGLGLRRRVLSVLSLVYSFYSVLHLAVHGGLRLCI